MCSIFRGMHVMKSISSSTIIICERASWYKDTMTEDRYLCTVEFVSKVLLYHGKPKELVCSTNSLINVNKFFDPYC
jgi:hypothetical protein